MEAGKAKIWYSPVSPTTINALKRYIEYAKLKEMKHLKILDFGCGNGRYMYIFRDLFPKADICGVDIKEEDIRSLRSDFRNVQTIEKDRMDLRFPPNYFDLVFSSNVIEHIPKHLYVEYLKKIQEILKPRGRFVFGTPNYPWKRLYDMKKAFKHLFTLDTQNFLYYLFDDPTHINKLNYNSLCRDLSIFSRVELYPAGTFLRRWPRNKKYSDKIVGIAYK